MSAKKGSILTYANIGIVSVHIAAFMFLKSASNLNGNLNCSKELEHYAS